jgi:hypothetical protein
MISIHFPKSGMDAILWTGATFLISVLSYLILPSSKYSMQLRKENQAKAMKEAYRGMEKGEPLRKTVLGSVCIFSIHLRHGSLA